MPHVRRMRYEVEAGTRTEDRWFLIHLDAVAIGAVLSQKTRRTPRKVIEECRERLHRCDEVLGNGRSPKEAGGRRSSGGGRALLPRAWGLSKE